MPAVYFTLLAIVAETRILQDAIRENRQTIVAQIFRSRGGGHAARTFAAWLAQAHEATKCRTDEIWQKGPP